MEGLGTGIKRKEMRKVQISVYTAGDLVSTLDKGGGGGGGRGLIYERQTSEPEVELGLESRPDQH